MSHLYLTTILFFVSAVIPLLLGIAYFTLFERQILAALQKRQGPNIVGFFGILQPIADGVKLVLKESITPKSANALIFIFAPIFTFALALSGWIVIPLAEGAFLADFRLSLLFIFMLSSLGVHTVIMAGWSSNSKYAFLGGLRSAAQMISYEISLGTVVLSLLVVGKSLNFSDLVESQKGTWFIIPMYPIFVLFFVCALAETNRHPFDLPEAEAELVSGYNVEYSAMGFALFFLAEYSNIILMSSITTVIFLGGWLFFKGLFPIPQTIIFSLKTMIFISLFVIIRGILPRFRYDQLMRLGWKVFLPYALALFLIFASILLSFNGSVNFLN